MRRGICTAVAALLLALVAGSAAPAGAAKRNSFPVGFYGVNYSGNVELFSPTLQGQLWNRLAAGGAESARLLFNWDITERTPGNPNWSRIDRLVTAASKHGMSILATVEYAPNWAKRYPGQVASPPRNPADYTAFLTKLVKRYGTNGTFWGGILHRKDIPYNPVHDWAIWNEAEIGYHWYRGPHKHKWGQADAKDYAALLNASFTAVHTAGDPAAKVVLAALSINAPTNLQHFYDWTNIKGKFDVAAIQAYAGKPSYFPTLMSGFRNTLNRNGAVNVPIYVTEMTWPAAKGKANPGYANTGYMKGFITTQQGAANRLTAGYNLLRDNRSKWNIQHVYWYDAEGPYTGNFEYDYSGLLSVGKKNVIRNLPVYSAFQKSAQAAEGCAKKTDGSCR